MMERAEHLEWAKTRALQYLPGDPVEAAASFISDLSKHEDLHDHPVKELMAMHMFGGLLTERNCRELITGTN